MKLAMYDELAPWYHRVDPVDDHAEEARIFHEAFERAVAGKRETLLDLGSGGGHNAAHLKRCCVLIHDAICYMITRADLRATAETAYAHTRPGGAALHRVVLGPGPLFSRATWLEPLTSVGFEVEGIRRPVDEGETDEVFLCRRR